MTGAKNLDKMTDTSNTTVTLPSASKPDKHKPLQRVASVPKDILTKPNRVNFPTKKLRMRSLLWVKPSGDAVSSKSSFLAQLFPTMIVNLAAISVGFGYGFNSVIEPQLKATVTTTTATSIDELTPSIFNNGFVDDAVTSWIAGMFGLGAVVGGFASALIGLSVGRRRCMLFLTLPDAIGWVMIAAAANLHMVYIGRFLTGFAAAGYIPSILIYVGEISQPQHRGVLSAVTVPCMALGTLVAYCLGYIIPWNFAAIVGVVLPVVLIPGLLMISNSPHFYLRQGQEKAAVQAMEKFRSSEANGLSELLAIADVLKRNDKSSSMTSSTTTTTTGDLVREALRSIAQRKNRRPFLVINALFLMMLFSGDFSISFYAVDIFKQASSSSSSNSLFAVNGHTAAFGDVVISAVIVGSIRFIASLLFLPAIKYCTRKVLLTSSALVMGISMAVLGLAVFIQGQALLPGWLPLLCVTVYMAAVPMGLGSLPYVFIGEFFSAEMRPLLAGLTVALSQLELFLVVQTFPTLTHMLADGAVFWMYSGVCFAAAVFALIFVPETKGKSLEEIEDYFSFKKSLHVTPYTTPMSQRRVNGGNSGRPHPMQSIQFTL